MYFGRRVFRLILIASLVAAAFSCGAFGQTYSIKTVAGGGLPVNITGTSASLGHIAGIAADQHGNVFITVPEYAAVVRWDPTTKGLTLVAGNGNLSAAPGLPGDNGPATSAELFGPSSVAVDSAGTVYIADNSLGVRKVSGGVITTIPAALLGSTIAVDSVGNLYVAGYVNGANVIRKFSNGAVTTVAGGGGSGFSGDNGPATSAKLNGASGLAIDSAGNLYIADTNNNVIRKVSNGVITTVAGNATSGYSGDNGPATSAQLNSPYGVAVDSAGNLYIADTNNNAIRKVSSGVITTVAGGGGIHSSPVTSPSCAPWPAGFVPFSSVYYVSAPDGAGNRLLVGNVLQPNAPDSLASYKAIQNLPLPAAPDQLYCGSIQLANGYSVQAYVPTAAERQGDFHLFSGPLIDPHTNTPFISNFMPAVLLPSIYAWRIAPVDPGDNGPATSAVLDRPFSVAVDPAGNLYIADNNNARVRRVSNGVITTIAGNGTCCFLGDNGSAASSRLYTPNGVAVDPAGNLYIADTPIGIGYSPYFSLFYSNVYGNFFIRVREVSGGVIGTVAAPAPAGLTVDIFSNKASTFAVDSSGNLYTADQQGNVIHKVSNGVVTTIAGGGSSLDDGVAATAAQLNGLSGIAVDSSGSLFIADGDNYRVRKIVKGVITTVAGNGTPGFSGDNGPAIYAQLGHVGGIALDSAGDLYIADGNARVRKVVNGTIITVAGNGTAGFGGDNGSATSAAINANAIAVDSSGNLFIAGDSRIRKVSGGVITTVAGNGTPGSSGDNGPATSAQVGAPNSLAVDVNGKVYISDRDLNWIRVLTPSGPSCTASASPASFSPSASGGSITVAVQSSCAWAVDGLPAWITYAGNAVGTGSASVALSIGANTGAARSTLISIAGVPILVTQAGQPGVTTSVAAVVNAASGLSGGIAPGEIVVVYGSGLGPAQLATAVAGSGGIFGTQLAGTSVSFNGIAAPLIYTSSGQVSAVVPYGITGSTAQVTVTYQGQTSAAISVPIVPSAPGFFTANSTGKGQAAALNQDGSLNSAASPAHPGDVITVFATGEGQTSPPGIDGKPAAAPLPQPVLHPQVWIGLGSGPNCDDCDAAQLQYAGGAPGEIAGLMQINAVIPQDTQTGNAVPILVTAGSGTSQLGVTIAVR